MTGSRPNLSRRIQLFQNGYLERLTVLSAAGFLVLWAMALPAIAIVGVITAPTVWALPFVFLGLVVWTIVEYVLHRFIFHFEPQSALLKQAIFVIHGNHHADPNDPLRNLMPPIVSLSVGGLIWLLSLWGFGLIGTWFFLGFMVGYVAYDLVHYACHQFPMKGRVARAVKRHHMRHHHFKVGGNYAITGMIWDRVFSTRISSSRKA